jgi:RsiW-degrading membrane proteinase PrsW (M82 family)
MEQGNLRTIIIVVLVLFALYIIMKARSQNVKKRMEDSRRFRRRK